MGRRDALFVVEHGFLYLEAIRHVVAHTGWCILLLRLLRLARWDADRVSRRGGSIDTRRGDDTTLIQKKPACAPFFRLDEPNVGLALLPKDDGALSG